MNRVPGLESNEERWLTQERALSGASSDGGDALLLRALRTSPSSSPPPDFAAGVARAAINARSIEAVGDRGEQMLSHLLVAVMAIGATVCALSYGSVWTKTITSTLGEGALQWGLLGAACLAVSALPWRLATAFAKRTPTAG